MKSHNELMVEVIVEAAKNATVTGGTFQASIRDMFDNEEPENALEIITQAVSQYRRQMETSYIVQGGTDKAVSERRKVVNNTVNDIARLTRQRTGKTVVCVKRAPHFEYEVRDPKPRNTAASPSVDPLDTEPTLGEEPDYTWHGVRKACKDNPRAVMERLFASGIDLDELGGMFLEMLKEAKGEQSGD